MNLGLVLGGVAQGATDTYKMVQEQKRAKTLSSDIHDIAARTQGYAADVQANSPQIGSPIGSNGPSWSAEDAAMGGWGPAPAATMPVQNTVASAIPTGAPQ